MAVCPRTRLAHDEKVEVRLKLYSLRGAQRHGNLPFFRLCEEHSHEAISFLKRETATTLCQPDLSHPLKLNGKGSRSDGLKCPCKECREKAIRLFSSLRGAQRRGNLPFPSLRGATRRGNLVFKKRDCRDPLPTQPFPILET